MKNVKIFFRNFFCCFVACTFIFSLSVNSYATGLDVGENISLFPDEELLEVLPVDDVPAVTLDEESLNTSADSENVIDEISADSENVIDEISTDSLTVNANEVVLYSLLPEEDVYPSGAPLEGGVYMHLDTNELGDILVYVPVDYQYDSFTLNTNGQPINITASQISGYSYDGNDYNIRWSSFGVPTYRPVDYDYGTQYQTLTVNDILGTNIGFWAEGGVSYNYMLMYIMLGGLILIIAFKIIGK